MMPTAASRRAMCSGLSLHLAYLDTSSATLRSLNDSPNSTPLRPEPMLIRLDSVALKGSSFKAQPARIWAITASSITHESDGIARLSIASRSSLESPLSKASPKRSQGCSLSKAMCLVKAANHGGFCSLDFRMRSRSALSHLRSSTHPALDSALACLPLSGKLQKLDSKAWKQRMRRRISGWASTNSATRFRRRASAMAHQPCPSTTPMPKQTYFRSRKPSTFPARRKLAMAVMMDRVSATMAAPPCSRNTCCLARTMSDGSDSASGARRPVAKGPSPIRSMLSGTFISGHSGI